MIQYLDSWRIRLKNAHRNLLLFAAGVALMGFAGSMFDTTFNNFLSDTFNITAEARGFLEFPRELPGFLTALFAGLLFFTAETNIAGIAALCVGAGMIGVAIWGGGWWAMIALMTVWSVGSHLIMPVRSSISMDLAHDGRKGRRLGQIQGVGIAASILGYALVWVVMDLTPRNYRLVYIIGGVVALGAAVVFFVMRMPGAHLSRPKFVFRRRVLALLCARVLLRRAQADLHHLRPVGARRRSSIRKRSSSPSCSSRARCWACCFSRRWAAR